MRSLRAACPSSHFCLVLQARRGAEEGALSERAKHTAPSTSFNPPKTQSISQNPTDTPNEPQYPPKPPKRYRAFPSEAYLEASRRHPLIATRTDLADGLVGGRGAGRRGRPAAFRRSSGRLRASVVRPTKPPAQHRPRSPGPRSTPSSPALSSPTQPRPAPLPPKTAKVGETEDSLPPLERLLRCGHEEAHLALADALWEALSDADALAAVSRLSEERGRVAAWEEEVRAGRGAASGRSGSEGRG